MVSLLIDRGDEPDEFDMTESIRKKEKAVKASFRIEMTDEERKLRDSQVTNQYHTGQTGAAQGTTSSASALEQQQNLITMTKEDREELEADRLAQIAEEGQRESSDDGDGDEEDDYDDEDPDDDLNF